jgi:hypothetical protein
VAYLRIEEVPVVVVFLDAAFEAETPQHRSRFYAALEAAASLAGLAGDVVAIWRNDGKCTRFIAPPQQHPFFQVANYAQLQAQISGSPLAVETDKKR